jgi:hypothetical protein
MAWWQYAFLGAAGGVLVEAIALLNSVTIWQKSRRTPSGKLKAIRPGWKAYVDVLTYLWATPMRAILGAAAAVLFGSTGQISGAYAAVAFGFAAPTILAQLGSVSAVAHAALGDADPGPAETDQQPGLWSSHAADEGGAA